MGNTKGGREEGRRKEIRQEGKEGRKDRRGGQETKI